MIQSLVADAVSRALDHLYTWKDRTYKILLQIHDAVLLEVPIKDVEYVYDEVLPTCMSKMVPIRPTDLDGCPLNSGPYNLTTDRKVMLRWGEKISHDEAVKQGIPLRFAKGH